MNALLGKAEKDWMNCIFLAMQLNENLFILGRFLFKGRGKNKSVMFSLLVYTLCMASLSYIAPLVVEYTYSSAGSTDKGREKKGQMCIKDDLHCVTIAKMYMKWIFLRSYCERVARQK